jgi:adenylate kinase
VNFILLGPPGSGKGTQAKNIVKKFNVSSLSTGEIFRNIKKQNNSIKKLISTGRLVPDRIVIDILFDCFKKNKYFESGFVLDGFPRTISQAKGLNVLLNLKHIKVDVVFFLDVNSNEVIKRILKRMICSCGLSYNIMSYNVGNRYNYCICGKKLKKRDDDKEKVIKERLCIYEKFTKPLIEYYKKFGILVYIDGSRDEMCVFKQINSYVKKRNFY